MQSQALRKLLEKIRETHIGVIGDYCVDAYWTLNSDQRELSIETGKPTHAVINQEYSLGGAGNVVKNLVDLGVGSVSAFGVIGEDVFGREMLNMLHGDKVNTGGVIIQNEYWQTSVYAKPFLENEEQERIDFGRFNTLSTASEEKILECIESKLPSLDGLIVNQQLAKGVYTDRVVEAVNSFSKKYPSKIFIVNSRHQSNRFKNFILRMNACEAARLCGKLNEVVEAIAEDELKNYAHEIFQVNHKPIFISRGARGVYAYDGLKEYIIPGVQIKKPIDTVGAGDTGVSATTAALCAGAAIGEAAEFSNLAAAVTVQKLQQTGTASPMEILEIGMEVDYQEIKKEVL